MQEETLIPLEKYAAMNRESIHKVIKKTMSGELQSVVKEENGRKKTYVVLSGNTTSEPQRSAPEPKPAAVDYKEAYEALQKEMEALKAQMGKGDQQ